MIHRVNASNDFMFIHQTDEELKTFVSMDDVAHRLTLKCKLINTKKVMTFCRFMRMADEIGYNLLPGQGNDKYR